MQGNSPSRIEITLKNLSLLFEPIQEIYLGLKSRTIPWQQCVPWMIGSVVVLTFRIDQFIIINSRFRELYPYHPVLYRFYVWSLVTLPLWVWAWSQVKSRKDKLKTLTAAFKNAGLQSKVGRLPNLISDYALDPLIRKMRLTNAGFPISRFQEQSKFIESELGIFIDEIRESREKRCVDFIYSHYPMPTEIAYETKGAGGAFEFIVGQTRAHIITSNIRESPHLLVAGQTGGGKSTFLRQFIVHLHLKSASTKFLLIDLKGGLEFSMFEQRSAFTVVPHVLAAVEELKKINQMLDDRMALLKANQCKDIEAYAKKEEKEGRKVVLHRQIVVVDEAAEMFLAGLHAKAKEIQEARGILSRIARQGRAVGVNLVVATQRPDAKSLDPQVKSNLTSVICFQMMNDSSSIAVLGNGRATDLPRIPGRAIWKHGMEMLEVQTPFLSAEEAGRLLGEPDNPTNVQKTSEMANSNTESTKRTKADYQTPKE